MGAAYCLRCVSRAAGVRHGASAREKPHRDGVAGLSPGANRRRSPDPGVPAGRGRAMARRPVLDSITKDVARWDVTARLTVGTSASPSVGLDRESGEASLGSAKPAVVSCRPASSSSNSPFSSVGRDRVSTAAAVQALRRASIEVEAPLCEVGPPLVATNARSVEAAGAPVSSEARFGSVAARFSSFAARLEDVRGSFPAKNAVRPHSGRVRPLRERVYPW